MNTKEIILNEIIKEMEGGNLIWQCPYFFVEKQNFVSKKPYSGINRWLLYKYTDKYYLTFNQIQKLGGHLKKGSKGIKVIFWKTFDNSIVENEDGTINTKTKKTWMLRYYVVFKQSDIEGVDFADATTNNIISAIDNIDSDISKVGAVINEKICVPHYNLTDHSINIPAKNYFKSAPEYYSTLFHELIHWTGKPLERFGQDSLINFNSKIEYSKEELIAEIGSAMLDNHYGTKSDYKNNAAYIQSWISYLKNNKEEIFTAASKSEKAYNFVMDKINNKEVN